MHRHPLSLGSLKRLLSHHGDGMGHAHVVEALQGGAGLIYMGFNSSEIDLHPASIDIEEQVRFGPEMMVDHAFGCAQASCDIINGGGRKTLFFETFCCSGKDFYARL